jgi:endonuclease YncB( thermonuclease family)
MINIRTGFLAFFLTLIGLLTYSQVHADITGRVIAVTDGDTIRVLDKDRVEHKVRLVGIDAPEQRQLFGNASKQHLAKLVARKKVFIESSKTDRYGRLLGKVWTQPSDCPRCGKTLDVNLAQVTAGMAWWHRFSSSDQSPEDRGRYESAEDEARLRKWGLWADPNPISPHNWRKGVRP